MEWPRIAKFKNNFGIYQETAESPIQMVICGKPEKYLGIITDLEAFSRHFQLDYPEIFEEDIAKSYPERLMELAQRLDDIGHFVVLWLAGQMSAEEAMQHIDEEDSPEC